MSYYDDSPKALQTQAGSAMLGDVRNREIVPNLKAQRSELLARVNKIDTLLAVLEKNPDFAKMFDLARELV